MDDLITGVNYDLHEGNRRLQKEIYLEVQEMV